MAVIHAMLSFPGRCPYQVTAAQQQALFASGHPEPIHLFQRFISKSSPTLPHSPAQGRHECPTLEGHLHTLASARKRLFPFKGLNWRRLEQFCSSLITLLRKGGELKGLFLKPAAASTASWCIASCSVFHRHTPEQQ